MGWREGGREKGEGGRYVEEDCAKGGSRAGFTYTMGEMN